MSTYRLVPIFAVIITHLLLAGCSDQEDGFGSKNTLIAELPNKNVPVGETLTVTVDYVSSKSDDNEESQLAEPPLVNTETFPMPEGASYSQERRQLTFTPRPDQVGMEFIFRFLAESGGIIERVSFVATVQPAEPSGTGTTLVGEVRDSATDLPVDRIAVRIEPDGDPVFTDSNGRFILPNLDVEATETVYFSGIERDDVAYAFVAEDMNILIGHPLFEGITNTVPRPVYLPAIVGDSTQVIEGEATVIRSEGLGVEVVIPADSARMRDGELYLGEFTLVQVDPERTPVSLPDFLRPSRVFSLQPGGVMFVSPVAVTFPNFDSLEAETETLLWAVSPVTGEFDVTGFGVVSSDGTDVATASGGLPSSSWFFPTPRPPGGSPNTPDTPPGNAGDPNTTDDCGLGSDVALQSGNLNVSHSLLPYQMSGRTRGVKLTYTSETAAPVFTVPMNASIDSRTSVPDFAKVELAVGGVSYQPNPEFSVGRAASRIVASVPARYVPTGVYSGDVRITSAYSDSRISSDFNTQVLVHNRTESPFGAGWGMEGHQRLIDQGSDEVVVIDGNGSIKRFELLTQGQAGETAIVFALDGSTSISPTDFSFQIEGLAAALEDRSVVPIDGSIRLFVMQFGGRDQVVEEVSDVLLDSENTLDTTVSAIRGITQIGGGTPISSAINAAADLLAMTGSSGLKLICLVTDGAPNNPTATSEAIALALQGVVDDIDALVIGGGGAVDFLRDNLGGSDSVREVATFSDFSEAVSSKLAVFLQGRPPGEFSTVTQLPDQEGYVRAFLSDRRVFFDAEGRHTHTEQNGRRIAAFEYDNSGRVIRIRDELDKITSLRYGNNGQISEIEDPVGGVTRFSVNNKGQLSGITDADGVTVAFGYDASGRMLSRTTRSGRVSNYRFGNDGKISSVKAGSLRETTFQSSLSAPLRTGVIGSNVGNMILGQVDASAVAAEVSAVDATRSIQTNNLGQALQITGSRGQILQTASRNRDGQVTEFSRPALSQFKARYDGLGRAGRIAVDNRAATEISYLSDTSYPSTISYAGRSMQLHYDAQRRFSGYAVDGVMIQTGAYDDRCTDKFSSVTDLASGAMTHFTFDALCNMAEYITPSGTAVAIKRDRRGYVVSESVIGSSSTREYQRNADGRFSKIFDFGSEFARYDRDKEGRITRFESAEGAVRSYEYDQYGAVEKLSLSPSMVWTYARDAAGNVQTISQPSGNGVSIDRAADGKLQRRTVSNGPSTRYSYNASDRVSAENDGELARTLQYNSDGVFSGETLSIAGGPEITFEYEHDVFGNLIEIRDSLGSATRYMLEDGQLQRVEDGPDEIASFARGDNDRITEITYGNGLQQQFNHSHMGSISSISLQDDEQSLWSELYEMNARGRLFETRISIPSLNVNFTESYTFDQADQLTSVNRVGESALANESFAYDELANEISDGRRYEKFTRLMSDQRGTFSYNVNGSAISVPTLNSGSMGVRYSGDGRVREATSGSSRFAFTRDATGRTWKVDKDGAISYHIHSQGKLRYILDAQGTVLRKFIYSSESGQLLAVRDSNSIFYAHSDRLQGVRLFTDNAKQLVQAVLNSAYGMPSSLQGPIRFPEHLYAGYHYWESLGFYEAGARFYDPSRGIFLQLDPANLVPTNRWQAHGYRYANNNPIRFVDRNGQESTTVSPIDNLMDRAASGGLGCYGGIKSGNPIVAAVACTYPLLDMVGENNERIERERRELLEEQAARAERERLAAQQQRELEEEQRLRESLERMRMEADAMLMLQKLKEELDDENNGDPTDGVEGNPEDDLGELDEPRSDDGDGLSQNCD